MRGFTLRRFLLVVGIAASLLGLSTLAPREAASQLGYNPEGISIATGTLTATQVRKLNATAVEVIAAPGSGKSLVIITAQYMLDYGGTAYDQAAAGENLLLKYTTSGNRIIADALETNSCLGASETADSHCITTIDGINILLLRDNQSASLAILNGEWATTDDDSDGNSPIHYSIRYRVVTRDLS